MLKVYKARYFELDGNVYVKESITWVKVPTGTPNAVELLGEEGEYLWQAASGPVRVIPDMSDPAYWDYYALPLRPNVVREMDKSEYDATMAARVDELRSLKQAEDPE